MSTPVGTLSSTVPPLTYTILAEPATTGTGWGAWVAELGVVVTADDREGALRAAASAARANIAVRQELGRAIPAPVTATGSVTIAAQRSSDDR